ncbi:predicted protein [Histoplasma capsulatum H143]|uniref:Uncharacterized protein n=1 Tax=Ajellomyces capsulatus (strain H143) TaxID=544712 RepID=C6HSM4_AJECH|nr:predicted protein [Histoplasma capsulatum H143]
MERSCKRSQNWWTRTRDRPIVRSYPNSGSNGLYAHTNLTTCAETPSEPFRSDILFGGFNLASATNLHLISLVRSQGNSSLEARANPYMDVKGILEESGAPHCEHRTGWPMGAIILGEGNMRDHQVSDLNGNAVNCPCSRVAKVNLGNLARALLQSPVIQGLPVVAMTRGEKAAS